MTLDEFIDLCEISLRVWVHDFSCGTISAPRQPSEADMKRKVMRVIAAHQGCISVVLKKAE